MRGRWVLVWLALALAGSAAFCACVGQSGWSAPGDVWATVWAGPGEGGGLRMIVWQIRLPRIALAVLVGACLAVAGAVMQALFHNPLAEPYLVGLSSGAALGAVLASALGLTGGVAGLHAGAVAAFGGALGSVALVYGIAREGRGGAAGLLLTGVALGGVMQAMTTLVLLQSEANEMRSILGWIAGGLAFRGWDYVALLAPYAAAGCAVAWAGHRVLDAMATGEDAALHLGVPVGWARLALLAVASLLAAGAVAVGGIIGFVGLMVPHAARMMLGAGHARLVPACALGGGMLLLWSDLLARTVAPGQEVPVGIITGVVGGLFFLHLLRRHDGRVA